MHMILKNIKSNEILGGTIICEIIDGFDYTFMAYKKNVIDTSRGIIILLRDFLRKSKPNGYLDLGGGIQESDALASFKKSMGGQPMKCKRYRFIFNDQINKESDWSFLMNKWP